MESSRGLGSCVLRIVQCIMHFRCIAYAPSDTDALSLGRQTVAGWPVTSLPVTRRAVISEQASVQLYAVTSEGELHQYTAPPLSMLKVVKVPPWRFPTRFLHLFRARLVAMCSLALPGWALATGSPATASAARASLQSRRPHCLCVLNSRPAERSAALPVAGAPAGKGPGPSPYLLRRARRLADSGVGAVLRRLRGGDAGCGCVYGSCRRG